MAVNQMKRECDVASLMNSSLCKELHYCIKQITDMKDLLVDDKAAGSERTETKD